MPWPCGPGVVAGTGDRASASRRAARAGRCVRARWRVRVAGAPNRAATRTGSGLPRRPARRCSCRCRALRRRCGSRPPSVRRLPKGGAAINEIVLAGASWQTLRRNEESGSGPSSLAALSWRIWGCPGTQAPRSRRCVSSNPPTTSAIRRSSARHLDHRGRKANARFSVPSRTGTRSQFAPWSLERQRSPSASAAQSSPARGAARPYGIHGSGSGRLRRRESSRRPWSERVAPPHSHLRAPYELRGRRSRTTSPADQGRPRLPSSSAGRVRGAVSSTFGLRRCFELAPFRLPGTPRSRPYHETSASECHETPPNDGHSRSGPRPCSPPAPRPRSPQEAVRVGQDSRRAPIRTAA